MAAVAAPVAGPTQLAFTTEVNLSQPLTWCGNPSKDDRSPKQFLHEVDQRRIRCGWSQKQTIDFVGVCLKGAALDWLRSSPRIATAEADKAAFAGDGLTPWADFQALFLRSFLQGGKTHRIDQRRTFLQDPHESVMCFRSRGLEGYANFRDEQTPQLAKATTIQMNLTEMLQNGIASIKLEAAHFGHVEPVPGENGMEVDCADPAMDEATKILIKTQIANNIQPRIVALLRETSRQMVEETNSYLVKEFSKYLLVDGLYYSDTRKYAMDLISKGQDDPYLFWDFVHKFNETHHPTKGASTSSSSKQPSKDGGYCPGAGVANGLTGNADGLNKKELPHTPGAICDYCGKKNHVASQCQKKKNKEARDAAAAGGTTAKGKRRRAKAAALSADQDQPPQQQQFQQPPPQHYIQQQHHHPYQHQPPHPPPQAAAIQHHPHPPQQQGYYPPPMQHQQAPIAQQGHPGFGQGQVSALTVSPNFAATLDEMENLNGNAWC